MRTQNTSKHPETCVHCNGVIPTTERRKVDGRMHRHLICPRIKQDDNKALTKAINEWIKS
jgi:hypothetical protein